MRREIVAILFVAGWVLGFPFVFTDIANATNDLTAKELKQLLDSNTPVFLLNPLSEFEFKEAHIRGSVNIPIEQINETKKLPKDKDALIVTYCKKPDCLLTTQAADLLANRNFSNVATLRGGLQAWENERYPLVRTDSVQSNHVPEINGDQFKKLVGSACILDIRSPNQYGVDDQKQKFGPNVDNLSLDYKKKYFLKIPLSRLDEQYEKIPNDRQIVVLDQNGQQAQIAAKFLVSKNYEKVCTLKGGISSVSEK